MSSKYAAVTLKVQLITVLAKISYHEMKRQCFDLYEITK